MKYSEFKEKIEEWGEKYNYKPEVEDCSNYYFIEIVFGHGDYNGDYTETVCTIHKSIRFVIDFNWRPYKNFSDDARNDLFKIVSEFSATKPEDREDEVRKDNLDVIINRLEVIQTNAEDVMNWTLEEIQERSWNLRNTLEDIIIDLEERKEANKRE